jgi:3-keto-disaccharide hydrolase
MQPRTLPAGLLALALCVSGPDAARADDFKPEVGYKSLINGADLTGWRYGKEDLRGKTETPDRRFTVKDAVIVAEEGKGIKALDTVEEFNAGFDLKLEFRASLKSDSGVYVRGPQLQVRDFIRRGEQKQLEGVFKNDDWNELHIAVAAPAFAATVDGTLLAATDAVELTFKDGKPTLKVNGRETGFASLGVAKESRAVCRINGVQFDPNYKPGPKGSIGLQAETGKFEFRRIRIKTLE